MAEFTFADLYCGGGGASLGLKQAGLKHLWGIDSDKAACATYEANIGKAICADAASVDWAALERPDVLWASPPCQGFSVAGKRQKDDPRNFLVWGFVWAVAVLRPRAFICENVPGVGQGDWAQFPSIVRMALETLGYNVSVFKIDAVDYSVPQHRKRVFWAGCLEGWIRIPSPTHAEGGMLGLKPWVTVREALGIPGSVLWKDDLYNKPSRDGEDRVYDVSEAPAPSIDGRTGGRPKLVFPSRPVLAGNDKGTNPLSGEPPSIDAPHHAIDHTGFSLKTHTKAEQSMGGDRLYRRLTVADCLVLQGFPRDFVVKGNKTQQYRQVGNAVPPPVAEALARSALENLR